MEKLRQRLARLGFWAGRVGQQLVRAWHDSREVASQNGVSRLRMVQDLVILNATRGLGLSPYFQYRLYDPRLSSRDKRRFLPDTPWANARLWDRFNPKQYRCLYANKLIFNRFFGSFGLPTAKILGVFDPDVGRTAEGARLQTAQDLRSWLPTVAQNGFVFKPAEGVKGQSILVFTGLADRDANSFVTLSGDLYDASRLADFARDVDGLRRDRPAANVRSFLIEERIRPHPELLRFIGPTLCTTRIQTIVDMKGTAAIIAAVFKLQPKPIGVDQLIHGAVGCWVDVKTGVLLAGRTRDSLEETTLIPGTDTSFRGFQLPDWADACSLALRAASAFPWSRCIGWDIGLSDRGPVLVEGNEEWSPSLIQLPAPYGLMSGEFEQLYRALR
jgi:putative polysaccharide biosynthesis protein